MPHDNAPIEPEASQAPAPACLPATKPRRQCPPWRTPAEAARLFWAGVTVRTAVPIALLVGSVLSAVNDGAAVLQDRFTLVLLSRIAVNYLVPFLVASAGFLSAGRSQSDCR